MNEDLLTEQQSLALITQMINKAKDDYEDTGVGALMWGSLVSICALVTFGNFYWKINALNYIWFLTLFAIIPQVIISVRASNKKKYKTYDDDAIGGIWISFGVALLLVSVYTSKYQISHESALYLILYGIPTFATGYMSGFKQMLFGGIICWAFAFVCFYVDYPYAMLYTAIAAFFAWFVPGLILRGRYTKAKAKNV